MIRRSLAFNSDIVGHSFTASLFNPEHKTSTLGVALQSRFFYFFSFLHFFPRNEGTLNLRQMMEKEALCLEYSQMESLASEDQKDQ